MPHRELDILIVADAPGALVQICGVSLIERLLRTLQRLAVTRAHVLSATPELITAHLGTASWARAGIAVVVHGRRADAFEALTTRAVVVLSGSTFWDARLVSSMMTAQPTACLVDSAPPEELRRLLPAAPEGKRAWACGAVMADRDRLVSLPVDVSLLDAFKSVEEATLIDVAEQPTYVISMRRDVRPLWFPTPALENIERAERLVLDTAQNGTLDLPGIIHGPIETWIIARMCKTRITPNQITLFTSGVSAAVAALFAAGHLVAGTSLALVVGVLDGLDGKQARVKVETTPLGQREHALDYVLELSWWTALAYHFAATREVPHAYGLLLLLIGSDLIGRLAKRSAKRTTGRNLDDVAPIDRFARLVGARRNIYVWMLAAGLLAGAADKAFVACCYWGAATAAVHVLRAVSICRNFRAERVPH